MFSTTAVGKKISALRKERNMTQMELADLMGVSYQAVSNWERGNSMPDISKLPELAGIFGVTIDELLGSASPLLKSVAENKMESYLEENEVTVDEVAEAAPILKPAQVDAVMDSIQVDNMKKLAGVAPFVTGEKIGRMVEEIISNNIAQIQEQFMQKPMNNAAGRVTISIGSKSKNRLENRLEQDADSRMKNHDLGGLEELAPYLSEAALSKIAHQLIEEGHSIACIANYMDEDDVGECARTLLDHGQDFSDLLPFMDESDISECAEMLLEKGDSISNLLPFMDEDDIGEYARTLLEKGQDISSMIPFMNEDDVGECAKLLLEQKKDVTHLLAFMDEDAIADMALEMYETGGVDAIIRWAPFIDADTLQEIAETIIEKHGYKALLPLAPFLK